jgi:PAS domain S-box-containing protein
MAPKPTYDELEKRGRELEKALFNCQEAEKKLQESEQFLNTIFEAIQDGISVLDTDLNVIKTNRWMVEMYKHKTPLVGQKCYQVYQDRRSPCPWCPTLQTIKDGKQHNETVPYPSADDPTGWIELSSFPIKNEKGHVVHVIESVKDITERMQMQEAIKTNEQKFRSLFEQSGDGLAVHDANGNIVSVNRALCDLFGYTKEEFCKMSISDSHPSAPQIVAKGMDAFKQLKQKGHVKFETEFKTKSGDILFGKVTASQVDIGYEKIYFSIFRDITERKLAEEALRESENIFSLFMEHCPIYVFFKDENTRSIRLSKNYEQMLGRPIDELLDKTMDELFPSDLAKSMIADDLRVLNEGKPVTVEEEFNGRFYKTTKFPILLNDKPKYLAGYTTDITERRLAKEALRESEEKLARSRKMESMGLLAGGVAHDLNNILSGIVSVPELILMDLPEDSKLRKPIETMKESGHKAVTIVQDLLAVARGVAITKEPVNLNDIVSNYLQSPEFIKLKRFHPTVMVKTNLDIDLLNIGGSQVHIGKVVMNLVSNASEAIEGSGNVIISTMNRFVDRPIKGYDDVNIGEYAILSVSDDGSGISSLHLDRIFEPFYTKKALGRSGTGLGLAVVWNVVQDHNGYIDVTTDENGTTFDLYFPITRDEVSEKVLPIPIEALKGEGETILVIDDMESQREISCNMLNALGYKTTAVSSGEEAIEYLKDHTIDLILLDMIMDPGINGRETYEKVIKIHPKQKAIIFSGFAETDDVKETQKLGAGKYLKKPVTFEKIGLAVKEELMK